MNRDAGGERMPTSMRISVVIPSKNRPAEILRCLASIYEHSPQVEEVIVVDQSSPRYELATTTRPNASRSRASHSSIRSHPGQANK